jgi:molybdopterin synthase catalytic subunit
MRVVVRFFAGVRETAGQEGADIELAPGATVADLRAALDERFPRLRRYLDGVRYAVNWEYADADALLNDGDEVALIPPVAGGALGGKASCWVTDEPVSEEDVRPLVECSRAGAIVVFLGVVRDNAEGRAVVGLDYEAYGGMAEQQMDAIAAEAHTRWPVERVAIVHRVGRLRVGEVSVAVAVASAHRKEALAACAYIMDRIKRDVPIWKRERWADGDARWVGDETEDAPCR